MRFREFIEQPLVEGGKALKEVSKITQVEVREVVPDLLKKVQVTLGLKAGKVKLIGSGGKKPNDEDTSSDIDLAVECEADVVEQNLEELAEGHSHRAMKGINVYSFAHEVGNKLVQVDLIPVSNIKFAEWSYQANAEDLAHGLKGAHRNEIFFAIAKYMPTKVTKKDDAGEPLEMTRYFYDLSKGVMTGKKSRLKSNGKISKNFATQDKKVLSDDPVKITKLFFGDHVTPEQVSTFDGALQAIKSPEFVLKDKLSDILKQVADGIKNKGLKVPSSLESKLTEMTMKAGDLSYNLSRYFDKFVKDHKKFDHVGDIEKFQVLKNKDRSSPIYLLMSKDDGVAFFEVKVYGEAEYAPYKNSSLINVAFIAEKYRGKDLLEKFIWFLKKHEGASRILIGDVHSVMMIPAIKKLSKKFTTNWVKKYEKVKYDPDKLDDFYNASGSTGWLVLFENSGSFERWPRFFNEASPDFRQRYDWLLED